jgi:hypothetical protein
MIKWGRKRTRENGGGIKIPEEIIEEKDIQETVSAC